MEQSDMSVYGGPDIITDGLVLHLDAANRKSFPPGGTSIFWYDLSGNDNIAGAGSRGAIPSADSGPTGGFTFDGADDYMYITSSSDFAPGTGDFTFQCWINPSSWSSSWNPVFVVGTTGGLWIGKANTSIFVLRAYGVSNFIEHILPSTSTWTNIAVTRSGTSVKLYYDGLLVDSGTTSQNFVQSTAYIGSDGAGSYFEGKIASILFHKGNALSADEIRQNYNALKGRYGLT